MASFRDFLDELRKRGELKTLDEEVDWHLQSSAICSMSQRVGGPAFEFTNIKGYPGARSVGSAFAGPSYIHATKKLMQGRIATAMGLEPRTSFEELQHTLMGRMMSPIAGIEVESGPCQEVVKEGSDVDLFQYPIPYLHDKDGGRYLTNQVVITMDPETKTPNLGVYRLMLNGRNTLVHGGVFRNRVRRDIERIQQKYEQAGEPMPFAIVIGAPPAMMMMACMDMPQGAPELLLSGGLGAAPLTLVKAKLSDIMVSADAEIILEGHVYPGEKAEEGPFAGISYYSTRRDSFVYKIERISQRKDPILPFVAEGQKGSDSMCLLSVCHSLVLMSLMPLATMGYMPKYLSLPIESKLVLAVVSLPRPQPAPGFPGRMSHFMFNVSPFVRQALYVDDDVEAEDILTIMSDQNYKVHRDRGIYILPDPKPAGLTENHDWESGVTSCGYMDATWRLDRPDETLPRRAIFDVMYPDEMKSKVIKAWNEEFKISPKV